jgi:hypothetical protein
MSDKLSKAYEVKRLFDRFMEQCSSKLDQQDRLAQAATKMDDHLGSQWREYANAGGVDLIEIVEGGLSPEPIEKREKAFFDKLRRAMLDEEMEVGKLIEKAELKDSDVRDSDVQAKPDLMNSFEVHIKMGPGNKCLH